MKGYRAIILFFALTINYSLFSQNNTTDWFMFIDGKTGLTGYKDILGVIKIEPKFTDLTSTKIFKNIIPVMEELNPGKEDKSLIKSYYLLKNGKKVGMDSLYIWDWSLDCESEEKIRFRDSKTDKVGFFNKNGKVVIPAIYNDAKPFYNSLALTIKDAKRMCWEGGEYSEENPCEHWGWKGNIVLININNEIVLDDLSLVETSYLDWYSLKINQTKLDSIYISLKSKSGNTYSFIDIHKQFEKWFYQEFIPKNKTDQLENELFEILAFDKEKKWRTKKKEEKDADFGTWILDSKKEFFSGNKKKIYKILDKINHKSYETIISNDSSPILFDDKNYPVYFTDCGIYDTQKYPYFTVTITKNTTGKTVNSLGFIRTQGGGYKLLEID